MTRNNAELLKEIRERGEGKRLANVVQSAIDVDARTAELAFSSETDSVERFYGVEILGHGPDEVNLSRLNSGGPLLWMHNANDQRGVIVRAWVDGYRVGRALVRFSQSAEGEKLFRDVRDGIVTKVSVGYTVEGLTLVEERADGTPVYRATAWTPYEISMVSVAADDTVGVGRAAEPASHTRSLPASPAGHFSEPKTTMTNTFQKIILAGRSAKGDYADYAADGSVRHIIKRTAAAVSWSAMADTYLSPIPNIPGRPISTPSTLPAGERFSFTGAVLQNSKANQHGACIFVLPQEEAVSLGDGTLGFTKSRHTLEVLRPSAFAQLADGDDAAETPMNLISAEIDRATMPSYAAHHRLSRAEQRDHADEHLSALAGIGIASGVANLVDRLLWSAVLANGPSAFSLAAVAALGLGLGNVAAVVGTDGAGADVDANGILRVHGVPAVLTDQIAETIVYAPAWTGVALAPDMGLVAERLNVHGDLGLVAYVNMQPLLPVPAAAWVVA